MKKLLVLALAVMVVFCFAACSQSAADITADTAAEIEEAIESVIEEAANEEEAISEEETEVRGELNAEFELGEVSGLNYENAFIGIGMDIPSDWIFYTDEQLLEINNLTQEAAGKEFKETVKNSTYFYDMYAIQNSTGNNVNIVMEKLDTDYIISADMTDIYEANIEPTRTTLENMGCTDIEFEISTVIIDGKEFECMNITSDLNGIMIYQTGINIKCNGYMAAITVSSFGENTNNIILDNMYIL